MVWANVYLADVSLALNFALILVLSTFLPVLEMLTSIIMEGFFASSDLSNSYGPKGKPKTDLTEGCSWNIRQGYTSFSGDGGFGSGGQKKQQSWMQNCSLSSFRLLWIRQTPLSLRNLCLFPILPVGFLFVWLFFCFPLLLCFSP